MNNLKRHRKNAGFTQKQLAEKASVNFRTLQHYEQGSKDINGASCDMVLKLARALNCTIEDLMNDTGE